MTELIIFWSIVLAVAALLATLREIYDDGHGHRPPPRSHVHEDWFESTR